MTTSITPPESSAASVDAPGASSASAIVRTQRALQILRQLQAGQVWSPQELAIQFNCSTRTIFRDIQLLRGCGIPIDSPRGEKGIRLAHDFFWKPERPTLDEMIALVVGARVAGEALPKDLARNLESAIAKLIGSERPAVRQRLNEVRLRIDSPHVTPLNALPDAPYLPLLLEHIVAQTVVRLKVAAVGSADPGYPAGAARAADPSDTVPAEQLWHVIPLRLHYDEGQWMLEATTPGNGPEQAIPLAAIRGVEAIELRDADLRDVELSELGLDESTPNAPLQGGLTSPAVGS
jgi:biotin operon repressor